MPHVFYRPTLHEHDDHAHEAAILLRDEQESKLGEVDECIFEAYLLIAFASVAVGFWYFTALARTFVASFKQISKWKEQMDTINGIIIFGQKYVDWRSLKL
jgi:hypothetical protein